MVIEFEAFRQPALESFIANAPQSRNYRLGSVFPTVAVDDIESVYNIIESQPIVAGSIVGFDAGTPLRSKGQAKQAIARLTKIAHAYKVTETEMFKFRNPRTSEERNGIVESVLMSTKDLSDGVDDTVELLRADMLYRGVVKYKDGIGETQVAYELERPDGNDIDVTNKWSDSATSTPLDDIEKAVKQYMKENNQKRPDYIVMTPATYSNFKSSKQVKDELYRDGLQPRIITDGEINNLFTALNYPALAIEDNFVTIEEEDGSLTTKPLLEDGKVVLHASVMGSTLSGPSAEKNFAKGRFAYSVQSQDPIGEKVIVGEVILPVLQNFTANVIMSV